METCWIWREWQTVFGKFECAIRRWREVKLLQPIFPAVVIQYRIEGEVYRLRTFCPNRLQLHCTGTRPCVDFYLFNLGPVVPVPGRIIDDVTHLG